MTEKMTGLNFSHFSVIFSCPKLLECSYLWAHKKHTTMKKLITLALLTVIALVVSFPTTSFAGNNENSQTVYLRKKKGHKQNLDNDGIRIPSRPLVCLISSTQFQSDLISDEIDAYEIWDVTGDNCLVVFGEDYDFCQYLFNVPGEYEIRIITGDYAYVGYISTLQ